jgi:hypothetical protein
METIELSEMLASVQVTESEANVSFLPVRCWQNAMARFRMPGGCRSVSGKTVTSLMPSLHHHKRRATASL